MEKNSIETVNDVILFNWLKYVSEGLKEIERTTEYEALKNMVKDLNANSYTLVISNYFDYTYNKTISPLKDGLNDELIEEYHNSFRKLAKEFNIKLGDSLFNRLTFEESPYAMAILKGENGEDLQVSSKFEVYDSNRNLVCNTSVYKVYVPIDAIKGNNDIVSLPNDSIIVDDLTYVLDTNI